MKLSPKAVRFVTAALREFPDAAAADRLRAWTAHSAGEALSPEVAALALAALERFEASMKQCLETSGGDEDRAAELVNDIRFVQTIEGDLRKEGVRAVASMT